MHRSTFDVTDFSLIKEKVLSWVQQFNTFCFLDNHQYQIAPHTQECLVAAGLERYITQEGGNDLSALQEFIDKANGSWLFGHLAYDAVKNSDEPPPQKPDALEFPDFYFFQPSILIWISEHQLTIEAADPAGVADAINNCPARSATASTAALSITGRMEEKEYLEVIRLLQQHILRGDCYEINFCQEFFAENAVIDPVQVYKKLSKVSPNPFSALYRLHDKWVICASPERFLKKQGQHILSQPIKGTSRRVPGNGELDEQQKTHLFNSAKDRSENVMVVDLVRNDLAMICREGSVQVDELYGVYSFPQVHQMISTISGELEEDITFTEILAATFPMGSMTGAPKKKVMELIDQYETRKRGIFSGAMGYIAPNGDFDFNVVIRSILYNASNKYLSFPAGSGITFYSDPHKEWEECLLKAAAIRQVLAPDHNG